MAWYNILLLAIVIYMVIQLTRATFFVVALVKEYRKNPAATEKKVLEGIHERARQMGISDEKFEELRAKAEEESKKRA